MVLKLLVHIWCLASGILILLKNSDYNGHTTRLKYIGNSQTVELYGRLHADLFNSDKMLINGVDRNIKLTRRPEAFYLLAPNDNTKVRIKIVDANLFITQVELKTPLLLAHANALAMKCKAHYPVTHAQIKTFKESSGTQQISINNAFLGPVPDRILIVLELDHVSVCCGWLRRPKHTQTCSNFSTIAADKSNGVTNTRCCRYSCMRS